MNFSSTFSILSELFLELKVELLTTVMMENRKAKYGVTEQHSHNFAVNFTFWSLEIIMKICIIQLWSDSSKSLIKFWGLSIWLCRGVLLLQTSKLLQI